MATSSARLLLPASTTRSGAPEGSTIAALHSRAPEAAAYQWNASFRVDLSAARPTPVTDTLDIEFTLDAFQRALPPTMHAFAHPEGLLVIQRSAHRLYCASIHIQSLDALAFTLSITPIISLVRTPSAADFDAQPVLDALCSVLPIVPDTDANGWQIAAHQLFAHFIDAKWNLPLPRKRGVYRLQSHLSSPLDSSQPLPKEPWAPAEDAPPSQRHSRREPFCTLAWNTRTEPSSTAPSAATIGQRTARALDEYAAGLPANSGILSATSFGDDEGAYSAMRLASLAAERNDTHTLQTLRITQQRLVDRGHTRLGVLSALFSSHAMLQAPKHAASLILPIATELSREFSWEPTATWFQNQCRSWFQAAHPTLSPLSKHDDLRETTKHAASVTNATTTETQSKGERPSAQSPSSTRPIGELFTDAYLAFQNDEDDLAWQRTITAIEAGHPIPGDNTASMILRLIARRSDHAVSTAALEAIVRDVSSELHYVRAVQLLADHYDAIGALERSNALLQTALKRFPDSILLRVSFAQFLSRIGHSSAERAWTHVLEHEGLEPWETREYTQERAAARAWQQQRQSKAAPSSNTKTSEEPIQHAKFERLRRDAIEALEVLHPPAPNAPPSNADELQFIERALQQRPSSNDRASMLARRAVLLLTMNEIERAAQSWTGALILWPHTASVLAGVAITRTLQDTERGSDKARRQFLNAAAQFDSDNIQHAQAIEHLAKLLH